MRKLAAVIAMTLAAGGLARQAAAAEPANAAAPQTAIAPAAAAAPADAHTDTPLGVRPSKPLTLQEPQSSGGGWKILVLAAAAGAGLWAWKRKAGKPLAAAEHADLAIVKRVSIGVRSELLVVRVDGQRLLVGVTPSSIETLATLGESDDEAVESAAVAPKNDRFASILEAARRGPPAADELRVQRRDDRDDDAPIAPKRITPHPSQVEGQARGLLSLGGRE